MTKSGIALRVFKEVSFQELADYMMRAKAALNNHVKSKGFCEPRESQVKIKIEETDDKAYLNFKFFYEYDETDDRLLLKHERGI